MSAKAVAAKALRVTGCSPEETERFAGAFVAVAEAIRDDVVSQIAQTAVVRPGDTLILRVADRTSMEYIDRCGKAIREKLPDVEVFFVGGVEEMAIYRPAPKYEVTVSDDVTPEQAARFAKELERQASVSPNWTLR